MVGFGFGIEQNVLFLSVAGPEAKEMPLTATAPIEKNNSLNLTILTAAELAATLFIGKDILTGGTGQIPLFLQPPFATGVIAASGGALADKDLNLAVSGTSFFEHNTNADLYMEAQLIASGVGDLPLTLVTDPAPTPNPDGTISSSGITTLVMNASNESGVFTQFTGDAPLTMMSHSLQNQSMDLYVDFPIGAIVPLTIKHKLGSGILNLTTDGAGIPTGVISMTAMAPFTEVMTLNSEGVDASGEAPTFE